jgi:5-(carboxyamino)imidazole ribonucleotide mutase
MGSQSDQKNMEACKKYLDYFGIPYDELVMSAHRNPHQTAEFAETAEAKGYKILIGAAGMAAHLCGVLAAHTTLPVIGVPMPGSHLNGVDALYSTVQMPAGRPVRQTLRCCLHKFLGFRMKK